MDFYESFLSLPLAASITIMVVPLAVITVGLALWAGRLKLDDRANDNVATAAIRLVGGAFIFVSAFAIAAIWQEANHVAESVGREFGRASVFVNHVAAQDIPGGDDLIREMRAYASIIANGELVDPSGANVEDGANEQLVTITRQVIALDKQGFVDGADVKVLLDSLASMTDARNSRLSQPHPVLPLPIFLLVTSLGLFTVIAAAAYPSGPDRRFKWLQALTAFAVVASLFCTVMFLLNGQDGWLRQERQRPAEIFMQESAIPLGL